ncbi:TPA: hypothetical protein U1617_000403 [Streptococcus suis]|nr:hypothetical protein [Streptococcus suis]HEM5489885.1 hypothetical protein [Streptococcus suis]
MKYRFDGYGNPGWSFTPTRMRQLNALFSYIERVPTDRSFDYMGIQDIISGFDSNLDDSKLRMFFPWLKVYGVFNDYSQKITYGQILTEFGRGFAKFVKIYIDSLDNPNDYSENQLAGISETFKTFVNNFYYNLLDTDKSKLYKLTEEIINEMNYLTFDEFFAITNAVKNNLDSSWIYETIQTMRDNPETTEVEIISNKNAWNYIIPFLKEAGIVSENKRVIYPVRGED